MKVFRFLYVAYLTLVAVTDLALAGAEAGQTILNDALVTADPVRPKFVSGIFAVCTTVYVETKQGDAYPVYLIYLGGKQFIPKAGDKCRIAFHKEKFCEVIWGVTAVFGNQATKHDQRLIKNISCSTDAFRYAEPR